MAFLQVSHSLNPSEMQQSPYKWVILALATSAFLMTFISRFSWPPLMPKIMVLMDINRAEGYAYMTAFYIGYIITQVPGGALADRFGPRLVLTGALLLQGVSTLGLGFTDDYTIGFALRIICGIGGGCVYSSCLKSMVTWFSPIQRGIAIAVVMSAPTLGVSMANYLLPALEASLGWQIAFQIVGLMVIALGILILVLMKEKKTTVSGAHKSFIIGLRYVLNNRNILLISLAGFGGLWVQVSFASVSNDYLVTTFNLSLIEAGDIMALYYGFIGLFASLFAGFLATRLPNHIRSMVVVCHILMATFCLAFLAMTTTAAAIVGVCLVGMTVSFANPLYAILLANNTAPEWMATAGGVSNTIFQMGALISPLVVGRAIVYTGGFDVAWWILGLGALSSAVWAILIKKDSSS